MDEIRITDLEVYCRVGVPDAEREHPQRLLVSVVMEVEVGEAARSDDLTRTIDYGAVAVGLERWGEGREFRLIERMAVEMAEWILGAFRPERVVVEVKKFILPRAAWVSVRVRRGG